jgi:transposase-like protein
MKNELKTLQDAIRYFSDEQVCIDTVASMRFPNGPQCPACLSPKPRQHWLANQRRWQCRECGKQYSVKVNTIFEDSPIKLDKWLTAMWMLANCRNGVSSYEIHRSIGVTQKSAWFMLQRIRLAMKNNSVLKMGSTGGPVEVDEVYIGGDPKNKHKSKINAQTAKPDYWFASERKINLKTGRGTDKIAVFGMLDRDTRKVRAQVIPNVKREVLLDLILKNIQNGGTGYSDSYPAYRSLEARNFVHETVNHVKEYVRGEVHTNSIENFWSLLKRSLKGTYVAVEPFHLDRYIDEQAFRYNNRPTKDNPLTDNDRFMLALSQISGKRLTYAELTGKVGESAF